MYKKPFPGMQNPILSAKNLTDLYELRHLLHQQPEHSGAEYDTAQTIRYFLQSTHPTEVISQLGGHGLAFIYDSGQPGPSAGFRCELDALPIHESNEWAHRSLRPGISHKCGHDGHMSIVAGLGLWLEKQPLQRGRVILLFQPAEETGEGAAAVMKDPRWQSIKPNWLFGLHNIPGFALGEVFCKNGTFCAASKGLLLKLQGITSHAAEPEKGRNPAHTLASIMLELESLPSKPLPWQEKVFATPVYARLGEKAFGTSAGDAEYGLTLRTFHKNDMQLLQKETENIIEHHCRQNSISYTISYQDDFPATVNHKDATAYVRKAANAAGLPYHELENAFRWSEDFGFFSNSCPTAFIGLGAGEEQAPLHHPDYDFPDQLIAPGVELFTSIIEKILKPDKSRESGVKNQEPRARIGDNGQ